VQKPISQWNQIELIWRIFKSYTYQAFPKIQLLLKRYMGYILLARQPISDHANLTKFLFKQVNTDAKFFHLFYSDYIDCWVFKLPRIIATGFYCFPHSWETTCNFHCRQINCA
jgi:hypothetical protein